MAIFPTSRESATPIKKFVSDRKISTAIVDKTVTKGIIVPVGKTAEVCSKRQLKTRRKLGIAPLNLVIEQDGLYAAVCDGRNPLFIEVESPDEIRALYTALKRCAFTKGRGAAAQDKCARDLAAEKGAMTKADRKAKGLRGWRK